MGLGARQDGHALPTPSEHSVGDCISLLLGAAITHAETEEELVQHIDYAMNQLAEARWAVTNDA